MKEATQLVILASLTVVLEGCPPSTIPLKDALQTVQNELVGTQIVNLAQLSNETIDNTSLAQPGPVSKAIRNAQCSYDTDNPLLPILAKDFSLSLQGTFTTGGNVGGGGLGAVPSASIGVNVADSKTLGITVPITFTYLEYLPQVYLQQRASYFSGITDPQLQSKLNGAEIGQIYDQIKERVAFLRSTYPDYKHALNSCKGRASDNLKGRDQKGAGGGGGGAIHTY